MKNYCFFFLVVAIILPINYGLRCYSCVSEKNLGSIFGQYHEDCKEGDLPDSVGIECNHTNIRDYKTMKLLTPAEVESAKAKQVNWTMWCTKGQGKYDSFELTAKGCAASILDVDKTDRCGESNLGVISGTVCQCFNNLCNGTPKIAGSMLSSIIFGLFASLFAVIYC